MKLKNLHFLDMTKAQTYLLDKIHDALCGIPGISLTMQRHNCSRVVYVLNNYLKIDIQFSSNKETEELTNRVVTINLISKGVKILHNEPFVNVYKEITYLIQSIDHCNNYVKRLATDKIDNYHVYLTKILQSEGFYKGVLNKETQYYYWISPYELNSYKKFIIEVRYDDVTLKSHIKYGYVELYASDIVVFKPKDFIWLDSRVGQSYHFSSENIGLFKRQLREMFEAKL